MEKENATRKVIGKSYQTTYPLEEDIIPVEVRNMQKQVLQEMSFKEYMLGLSFKENNNKGFKFAQADKEIDVYYYPGESLFIATYTNWADKNNPVEEFIYSGVFVKKMEEVKFLIENSLMIQKIISG